MPGPAWLSEGEQAADEQRGGEDRKVDQERGAVSAVGWQVLAWVDMCDQDGGAEGADERVADRSQDLVEADRAGLDVPSSLARRRLRGTAGLVRVASEA